MAHIREVEILDYADQPSLARQHPGETIKVRPIRSSEPKKLRGGLVEQDAVRPIGIEALPREDLYTHDA